MKEHVELNTTVAEKIMGWECFEEKIDGSVHRKYKTPSGHIRTEKDIPSYAEDLREAWHVVTQMLGNDWQFVLTAHEGGWGGDIKVIVEFRCRFQTREPGGAEAATLPLAICYAALDAVEA